MIAKLRKTIKQMKCGHHYNLISALPLGVNGNRIVIVTEEECAECGHSAKQVQTFNYDLVKVMKLTR